MDNILQVILPNASADKTFEINNLQDANTLVIANTRTGSRKVINYTRNFQKLLNTLTEFNGSCKAHFTVCDDMDDENNIPPPLQPFGKSHDWVLECNYFSTFIKPFILKRDYEMIKNYIDFDRFLQSDKPGFANECVQINDYCYWPNMTVLFFGWRLYLYMKFAIDIGHTIPIVCNRRLGATNLIVFEPEWFLNVELCLKTDNGENLFVNGRHKFNETNETIFTITMADQSKVTCKVLDEWTYSNKNFFDYIRDNINLEQCETNEKFKNIINVNLKSLRHFLNFDNNCLVQNTTRSIEKSNNVIPEITASSENADFIHRQITVAVAKLNEAMLKVMMSSDRADDNVLQKYFEESKFINFDYIIFVIWKTLTSDEDFAYKETDIKLFLELLCEYIFGFNNDSLMEAKNKCKPYVKLEKTVFNRLCNHWTFFNDENPYTSMGYFFGIHYMIYLKMCSIDPTLEHKELWAYTFENVLLCEIPADILCKGYLKKLEVSSVTLVFDGKHFSVVKKEDELYKLTAKCSSIRLSGVKFNNWKYLYFTSDGVFNVFTNGFHSSCPFILGTTLPHSFKKPTDKKYLSEDVFNYMLKTSEEEKNIFRVYHIAKLCRDVKMLKTDVAIVKYLGTCKTCQSETRVQLDDLFRDLWNLNDEDLVTMALYLEKNKVLDILHNFKCNPCRSNDDTSRKKCSCFRKIKINKQALKVCLIVNLFGNDMDLCELMWILIFSTKLYVSTLMLRNNSDVVQKYAQYFLDNCTKVISCLYRIINDSESIDVFMETLIDKQVFFDTLHNEVLHESDQQNRRVDDSNYISKFYVHHFKTMDVLCKFNVWWDKIILAREKDDLSSWLTRFYMRIILSRMNLKEYSFNYLKKVVQGYLYFKRLTNFNHANSMMMLHFAASLGIPSDYGKKAIYMPGDPGSGKSSFFELLDHIVLMHKHDCAKYGLSTKETDEMEVNKLNSQLYVINEMKSCNDSFFKSSADSSKSDSKCRKYQGGLKYEANYKLLVVNNKPLHIIDYDKGVHNRFAIIYTDHKFVEDYKFEGSIYAHIKSKKFPSESVYYEALYQPVRLFLSHVLMYRRDPKYGFIQYKNILKNDPIHKHNLLCLDTNNSPLCAIIYILNIKTSKNKSGTISENKMEEMIVNAVPYLETFLHKNFFISKGNKNNSNGNKVPHFLNEQILLTELKEKFKSNYNSTTRVFFNLSMALHKNAMNTNVPIFKC
ncbi:DNA helicase [Parapoynx stagnalis nucleopolyhedrovirus]|uniref:DNA helicase n=1 Tax=Parapoynx stagnalis nucleopolyhedrovirus TaxID=2993413 RepID=A0A9E7YAE9_9ABAC|nr:DNA helicase [Parapoynx stagnalis nucleopolyhedrovirus]